LGEVSEVIQGVTEQPWLDRVVEVAAGTWAEIPFWLRAALFVFIVVASVVSKMLLPAMTKWAQATRRRVDSSVVRMRGKK